MVSFGHRLYARMVGGLLQRKWAAAPAPRHLHPASAFGQKDKKKINRQKWRGKRQIPLPLSSLGIWSKGQQPQKNPIDWFANWLLVVKGIKVINRKQKDTKTRKRKLTRSVHHHLRSAWTWAKRQIMWKRHRKHNISDRWKTRVSFEDYSGLVKILHLLLFDNFPRFP